MPKSRMFAILALLFAAVLACMSPVVGGGSEDGDGVQVNGHRLTTAELELLERVTGAPVPEANYWYDKRSGLWGHRGGPAAGTIAAGLDLGGPLAPDASGGTTGVFFNGREITGQELYWLQVRYGAVPKGRYWLDGEGMGGVEGGPLAFDLRHAPSGLGQNQNSVGGWSTYGGGSEDTEWPGFRIQND